MRKFLCLLFMFASISFSGRLDNMIFKDLNGKIRTLQEYKGKKVYVKIWASGCPSCLGSMDKLIELAQMKNRGYEVLTITVPGGYLEFSTQDKFISWFKSVPELNNKFEVFMTTNLDIYEKTKIRGYPHNLFIDENGNIAKEISGVFGNNVISNIMEKI